jgi:hypothetical protein
MQQVIVISGLVEQQKYQVPGSEPIAGPVNRRISRIGARSASRAKECSSRAAGMTGQSIDRESSVASGPSGHPTE